MKSLPPNTQLLLAAHRFAQAPRDARSEVAAAIALPVEGRLYEQLRDACANGLKAKPAELHLVAEGIGELIAAIGVMLPPRVAAGSDQLQLPIRG